MAEQDEIDQIMQLQRRLEVLSAERSYQNAERTLSVWIRTALSLMIFGIAIDRFGLMLRQASTVPARSVVPDMLSTWSGAALIALGVFMVLATGIRFLAYAAAYRRRGLDWPVSHGPYLAGGFALLVALFGAALLILLLTSL